MLRYDVSAFVRSLNTGYLYVSAFTSRFVEGFLLKGRAINLSWSLRDMKERISPFLAGKPNNWMVWGVNERFNWVLKYIPFVAFVYVVAEKGVGGGLALYGVARGTLEIKEKYWPQGEKWLPFYLEIVVTAPGVFSNPENPASWMLIPRAAMERVGVRILPGPQKLNTEKVAKLKSLLEAEARKTNLK